MDTVASKYFLCNIKHFVLIIPNYFAGVKYGFVTLTTVAAAEWIKFEATDKTKPFMVLTYEFIEADDRLQAFTSFGQRTATLNPVGGVKS